MLVVISKTAIENYSHGEDMTTIRLLGWIIRNTQQQRYEYKKRRENKGKGQAIHALFDDDAFKLFAYNIDL